MESYEELLKAALTKVKPIESKAFDRFDIPRSQSIVEGKKTIINNFKQISAYIRRSPEHLLKYLLKELATPGVLKGDRLIMQKKATNEAIDNKIKAYSQEFVICKECGKPDTELMRQDSYYFVHCLACGAKHSVRSKI
jgi:translation initiation factor 2 subunit 2